MSSIDGPTLADRLQRRMPLTDVLSMAKQIVDALEAAHGQGIVHGDLTPTNIKLREDGTVKALGFGSTQAGVALGTAAYMAPEQAVGKRVDKRADIWSFGCVLYEMLAGRRAFDGAEISDTLSKVLDSDPDWTALPPQTPASIRRLLRRCLEKPINRRLADIADARLDLDEAASPSIASSAGPVAFPMWQRTLPWGLAVVFIVALAVVLVSGSPWRTKPVAPAMRLSVELGLAGEDTIPASPSTLAVSPDGNLVAFVPERRSDNVSRLYLRSLDRSDAVLLPGTDGARFPFFSPDSQWVAFFAAGKLKKIAVTGGEAITLCDAPNGRGGSWAEDGTIVFSPDQLTALSRVPSTGGTPQALTTLEPGEQTHRFPQILPGGKAVLYSSLSTSDKEFNFNQGNLVVQALPNGARKVVVRGGFYGRYALGGHLLYMHRGTLVAAPFDRERLELTGPERPVADRVISMALPGSAMFAVSSSGTLVYVRRFLDGDVRPTTWLDRSGRSTILRSGPSPWNTFSFAPDGRRLAFMMSDGIQDDIWVDDLGRDAIQRVTHFNATGGFPVWTPDGRRIAFASMLGEKEVAKTWNLYWLPADGTGSLQRLTTSPNLQTPGSWHPSGKILAFTERQGTHSALMLLPMEGDERSGWKPGMPTVFLAGAFDATEPVFSPDGRWLAYVSNQSGPSNVYVRPFPGPGAQIPISTSGGTSPKWSRTRPELIYETDRRIAVVSYSVNGDSFQVDQTRPWPEAQSKRGFGRGFDLHPDGERLVVPAVGETGPPPKWDRFELVLNLFDELRRIAPAQTR
jgi:serine/threonine-protein kinase